MPSTFLNWRVGLRNCSEILYDLFSVLGFPGAGLSSYEDTLVFTFFYKVSEGFIRHCVDMGLCIFSALALVHINVLVCVNRERTVWINGNQEQSRVCIDQVRLIPHVQIVNNRCFVKMCKFRHIICLVKLRGIDFVDVVGTNLSLL